MYYRTRFLYRVIECQILGIDAVLKSAYYVYRYKDAEEVVENMVIEAVKDQLNRRQATEGISKYFLKFLCSMCGITEVRYVCR